ncbi:hypothetical protein ACFS32_09300 [Novosphingobium pokkalii]|uniref:hypothetical protein n=1 Tax=Novosphingobium pokkalii TaxID=1770194 RepID=UPI0036395971
MRARLGADVIEWRDTWADQPRTADKASVMMGTLLGWAQERAHLSINVAARIPQLHQVNKSDQIWRRATGPRSRRTRTRTEIRRSSPTSWPCCTWRASPACAWAISCACHGNR